MKRSFWAALAIAAVLFVAPQGASAQAVDSDSQFFIVEVAPVIAISAPAFPAIIAHDTTDTNQAFATQTWSAITNNTTGATINWVITPFANGLTQRNARLTAGVASSDASAAWAMTTATDDTDYLSATPNGLVSAASEGPGAGTFGLNVVFLDSDYSQLPAGTYTSLVTGTITAN
jgi:hypothetical protein